MSVHEARIRGCIVLWPVSRSWHKKGFKIINSKCSS